MPSVLILCEHATLNGGERSMLSTLSGITQAGYEVHVAAPATGPLAEALERKGIEVVAFEPRDAWGVRYPLDNLRSKLAAILKRHSYVLLHANSLAMGRLSGPVAVELSVPSLSHIRDIVNLSRQAISDLNCHRRLLAVSAATRVFHVARGVAGEKTFVLYNGVDLERFCPRGPEGYLHKELGLKNDVPLIGTIGQISLRKGHDVLAAALAELASSFGSESRAEGRGSPAPESFPERIFAWLILGQRYSDKEESRRFEAQLHESSAGRLAGKIHFLGERGDVARVLHELTILVHPARQEPLGRVLLEAAAAGLAIVATDVGGTREIFPPLCAAASLVPPNDAQAMAAAVGEVLNDPALRRLLGQNARKRAEEAFDLRHAVAELLRHYAEIICGEDPC
jgi:glycosyltransferase involved in cell wall biosynthesis